jgi:protein-disulfide isomerase
MTQHRRTILCTLWVMSALLLAACSTAPVQPPEPQPPAEAEVQAEQPTLAAQAESAAEAVAPTEQPASQAETPADWAQTATLEGDFYVLGNPAAPVRLVDFSDFF